MLPLRDHNPSSRAPVLTVALIVANVAVFLVTLPAYGSESDLMRLFHDWALIPARVTAGDGYYTFLTSMFMHGGVMHLVGNMLFLWIFGDNLEDILGRVWFAVFYLLSGLAAAFAQFAADPGSPVPMVGASGAIAGVMGGYLVLFPRARVDVLVAFGFFARMVVLPAWMMLGLWAAIQLVAGAIGGAGGGGIAYLAHVGGFAAGLVLILPAWLRRGGADYWRRTAGHPPHPETRYRRVRTSVPRIRRR